MTPLEVLKKARTRIATSEHWTQGCFAKDADGRAVTSGSPNAACFCAVGALENASGYPWYDGGYEGYRAASVALQDTIYGDCPPSRVSTSSNIMRWNDAYLRKHEEVLAMFDKAIANLEAAE